MATIFFADSAGSQGSGDGSTAANACTLKEAIENDVVLHTALVSDSIIWVKNGTGITFDGSSGVFADTAIAGTVAGPIKVLTYTATTGDGGVTTITDTDAGATNNCFSTTNDFWWFHGFKLIDPRIGMEFGVTNTHYIRNVEVDNFAVAGFKEGGASNDPSVFHSCYAHDGTGIGFDVVRRRTRVLFCVASNNTSHGFNIGNNNYGVDVMSCIAHNNGEHGFRLLGAADVINCISNANTDDGYHFVSPRGANVMINSGATSNGAFGVNATSSLPVTAINCGLNPTNETNTSGKSGSNVILQEIDPIDGDPLFIDSSPATTPDFSLESSSAWKAAGLKLGGDGWANATDTFFDIGPAQREEPAGGGGGGLLKHPGMSGGMRG